MDVAAGGGVQQNVVLGRLDPVDVAKRNPDEAGADLNPEAVGILVRRGGEGVGGAGQGGALGLAAARR